MKSVSIGYTREDGDFAILATLNNKDGHVSDEAFADLAAATAKAFSWCNCGPVQTLEREDTPDYVELEA